MLLKITCSINEKEAYFYPYNEVMQELLWIPALQVKVLTFKDFGDLSKTAQLVDLLVDVKDSPGG